MTDTLNERLQAGFEAAFGGSPELVVRAPGRVNLIGEHTDYNDGFALPVAIGAETQVAFRPSGDSLLEVVALDFEAERDVFQPAANVAHSEAGGWRDYVRGTIAVLAGAGHEMPGGEMAIAGDIPRGTGLSSSASLEVAVTTAVLATLGRSEDRWQVALWAQRAENEFVGVKCGNLDQLSAAATVRGHALLIDCRSLELRPVPLPEGTAVVILQSGVVRGLLDGEYNNRRRECEEAAAVLGVPALRDADLPMLEAARDRMPDVVFRRARHVITDNARTLLATEALEAGDLALMGRLMVESHASQRDDFGITVDDTDRLAGLVNQAIADIAGGAGGARQTGGGFGGAVVAVLPEENVEAVCAAVLDGYRTPAGAMPDIYIETACDGASIVSRRP